MKRLSTMMLGVAIALAGTVNAQQQMNTLASVVLSVSTQTAEAFKQPYPLGDPLPEASAIHFSGPCYLAPLSTVKALNVPMANVTFAPGCRNAWHSHKAGQLLIATAGIGYYQERGKAARRLFPGDIVEIAPDVEHWHGAAPDSWFAHIAITTNPQINKAVWLDPVSDSDYLSATQADMNRYAEANRVLSARQQAIVAIAAYTGKGDLEHLPLALTEGLNAGMTVNEIKEILIQAYAYCGFPRSLQAIQTFDTLIKQRQAEGKQDTMGREAAPVSAQVESRYELGKAILDTLTGASSNATKPDYALFVPTIERFLKEHLFADIFERDLLTYAERELATISFLAGVGGVEPMANSHIRICRHLGLTQEQLTAWLHIVEVRLGPAAAEPLRALVDQQAK